MYVNEVNQIDNNFISLIKTINYFLLTFINFYTFFFTLSMLIFVNVWLLFGDFWKIAMFYWRSLFYLIQFVCLLVVRGYLQVGAMHNQANQLIRYFLFTAIQHLQFKSFMEKQKSKIHEILKKMSNSSFRTIKHSPSETPNPYSFMSPKKSMNTTPLKSSLKANVPNQRNSSNNRKYALNKTTYGTPHQKSTMMSYISTPNDHSMAKNKLKKFKSNRNITYSNNNKTVEAYQSTEDQNMSDSSVRVQFWVGKKKLEERRFFALESTQQIKIQMLQLIKHEKQTISNCFGIIGLDPIPYNHGIRMILNSKGILVSELTNKKIHELVVQPILVSQKPSFENMQLSDFELLKHLGSGGFSNVYLAKCEIDQKICALKFIRKQSITSAKKAKMLENEKQILFTIDSPDLVDLLYAFQTTNYIVFGLQYCENGNLYNFLQKHRKIPQADAKHIFKQILQGLQYLHQNNILFRDLKLENILFDEKGKLKITDFGLSKPEVSEEDITYSYCGSPQYMAPQMLAKCGHSFKVDYYALGILLYELLFGISPFYAPKKQDIFMAIMNSQPKFPKQIQVSKQVKQLIKGLLAKNPDHRIGSLKGIKQIKSHPWLRNTKDQKSEILNFQFQNLKISAKQVKEIRENFKADILDEGNKKYFFPKSFVNKKLIDDLLENLVVFPRKKQKGQKMIKSNSKTKINAK